MAFRIRRDTKRYINNDPPAPVQPKVIDTKDEKEQTSTTKSVQQPRNVSGGLQVKSHATAGVDYY